MLLQRVWSRLNRTNPAAFVCSAGLKSWTGGIKYDSFIYYPRFPGQKDPPYEPTKLLMVQRIKPFKGNQYWLKRIMVELKIDGKMGEISIVKNIPEVAAKLYQIKHLIRITPIRTPDGIPKEGDLSAGYLKENGEFVCSKRIFPNSNQEKITMDFLTDPARLDSATIIKDCRKKWDNPW